MIPAELLEVPEIAQAVDALKTTSYTQAELEQYDRYWDIVRTQKSMLLDAEHKGKRENAIHTAERLIAKGFSNEEIADISELDLAQIEALRQSLN
jgi:flagellar motor component MotA